MMLFDRRDQFVSSGDFTQNSIMALLKGPDVQYKNILTKKDDKLSASIIHNPCRDKNSFLQIHVRPLNAKQQKRLRRQQYRQGIKCRDQTDTKKDKCLRLTFPISYPCPIKSKKNQQPSITSHSSIPSQLSLPRLKQTRSPSLNHINQLKPAVSISFIDDQNDHMSIYKNSKENYSLSLLDVPSKKTSAQKIRSSNAWIQKASCQLCGSILSNDICSCIVQYLLQLNNRKDNDILVQLNGIFENLTSNNIIT